MFLGQNFEPGSCIETCFFLNTTTFRPVDGDRGTDSGRGRKNPCVLTAANTDDVMGTNTMGTVQGHNVSGFDNNNSKCTAGQVYGQCPAQSLFNSDHSAARLSYLPGTFQQRIFS